MVFEHKPGWDSELNLQPVTAKYPVQGGALRDEAGGDLETSGLLRLNTEGSEAVDSVAEASGLVSKHYLMEFQADPVKEIVVGRVVETTNGGALPVRRSNGEQLVSLHLGGVFKQHPGLRPKGRRACPVFARKDSQDRPCLVIQLSGGLAKIKGRKTGSGEAQPQPQGQG